MDKLKLANKFIDALSRQIKEKSQMKDGIEASLEAETMIISMIEEVGEVATDFARQRYYGAVAECVDVAHSALLTAISLDLDGTVIDRIAI